MQSAVAPPLLMSHASSDRVWGRHVARSCTECARRVVVNTKAASPRTMRFLETFGDLGLVAWHHGGMRFRWTRWAGQTRVPADGVQLNLRRRSIDGSRSKSRLDLGFRGA